MLNVHSSKQNWLYKDCLNFPQFREEETGNNSFLHLQLRAYALSEKSYLENWYQEKMGTDFMYCMFRNFTFGVRTAQAMAGWSCNCNCLWCGWTATDVNTVVWNFRHELTTRIIGCHTPLTPSTLAMQIHLPCRSVGAGRWKERALCNSNLSVKSWHCLIQLCTCVSTGIRISFQIHTSAWNKYTPSFPTPGHVH